MEPFLAVEHPPVGVQLPQGWNSPWDAAAAAEPTPSFGFIIFADRRHPAAAVLSTVASVRKHYADSPIQLLIDGGNLDFAEVCGLAKYFCRSRRLASENSLWNPHSFLKRVHEAASGLHTSHFILLEPDTLVRGQHQVQPLHDAGGAFENFEPGLHEESRGYLQQRGREANPCFKLRWPRLGLRGAAYFRRAAVLDAFSGKQVMRIDWAGLFKHEGKRALSSEFAMHAALSMQGYMVYPWREVSENWLGPQPASLEAKKAWRTNWPAFNEEAAFERGHRESFQAPLPPEEAKLLQSTAQEPEVVCYGCVWYDGPGMEVKRKIKQPDVDNSANIKAVPSSYKTEDKLVEEKALAEEYFPEGPSPEDGCHMGR